MTLKQKFEQYAKEEVWRTRNYNAEECELIADDFAIGFAEWIANSYYSYNFAINMFQHRHKEIYKTTKELLEIYDKRN